MPCLRVVISTPPPLSLHRPRSAHEVNTARCVLKSSSMRHTEGGWPKDVDPGEQADVTRYRKKVEKDKEYKAAIKALGEIASDESERVLTRWLSERHEPHIQDAIRDALAEVQLLTGEFVDDERDSPMFGVSDDDDFEAQDRQN